VNGRDLAVARGWDDTRLTLAAWNRAPWRILRGWLAVSLAVVLALLAAVWVIAQLAPPGSWPHILPGVQRDATVGDAVTIVGRNLLVLALHSLACLAGFIAKSSLPVEAEDYTGWWRWVHDRAGGAAIAFVGAATIFSLATQAYALGGTLSTLSWQFATTPLVMLLTVAPHALLELTALFLPLAAWMLAARAGAWNQLMAATFATTAVALPALVLAAVIEITITPALIRALHFV
jgi:hypothetical protein